MLLGTNDIHKPDIKWGIYILIFELSALIKSHKIQAFLLEQLRNFNVNNHYLQINQTR